MQGQAKLDFTLEERYLTNNFVILYLDTSHMIDVVIKRGEDKKIKIDVTVESYSEKKAVLDYLKRDGRYNLKYYEHPKFYATVLSLKAEIKYIFINKIEFIEKITYTVHLPLKTKHEVRVPKNLQPKQLPIALR